MVFHLLRDDKVVTSEHCLIFSMKISFLFYFDISEDKFVKSGDNITLQCSLLGNSFRWMKDSRIHLTDNKKYDGTSTSSLTVINTDRHDTGRYSCNVFTSLGVWRSGTDYKLNIICK